MIEFYSQILIIPNNISSFLIKKKWKKKKKSALVWWKYHHFQLVFNNINIETTDFEIRFEYV